MTAQTIRVTAGAAEYTYPVTVTETTGKNIAADTVRVCLTAPETTPTVWVAPSVDTVQADPSKRVVQLLVDSAIPVGTYYLWVKVTDSPEVVPRRALKVVIA